MDVEREEEAEPQGGWEWVKTQEEKRKKEREEVCGFVYLKDGANFDCAYCHDFCDTSAVLYQLSYQANWELVIL